MYAIVRSFLERLGSSPDEEIRFTESETRLAMAVLLFRVVTIDGEIRDTEMALYRRLLHEHLAVSPEEMALFETTVRREAENEASLFPFTTIVKKMPLETRQRILRLMHEISLSDNELHEFEINLVTRTAELLGLRVDGRLAEEEE